jgi:hypothetical protein
MCTQTCTSYMYNYYQHVTKWLASDNDDDDDDDDPLSSPSQFFFFHVDIGKYTDFDSNPCIQLRS